jgi:hypothetical protein
MGVDHQVSQAMEETGQVQQEIHQEMVVVMLHLKGNKVQ